MKKILFVFVVSLVCASCIKEEAPNVEADIEYCVIREAEVLIQKSDTLYKVGTESNVIHLKVKENSDLSQLAPEFILTEGASIDPPSGTALDFSNGQEHQYVVTSEDGNWQKQYTLGFAELEVFTSFGFEHCDLDPEFGKYYRFYELLQTGEKDYLWSTGNAGFMMAKSGALPDEYPSIINAQGRTGACAKLETKDVGIFGAMVGMRLAAGNLFIGTFDVLNATSKPLEATHFGVPFNKKPLALKGWYKYKAGESFQNADGKIVDSEVDKPDIYAVLYENSASNGDAVSLNGSDVLTSSYVVAYARTQSISNADDWSEFNLDFTYLKDIDKERLDAFGYNITVVFSSSINGAKFYGAVGSTFCIDDVELVCE